ncbi:MAG: TatD family hydrolase [Planctomycetota bacterium]
MFIVDTHAHLDFPDYKDDLDAVLKRARENNVHAIITVGITLESSRQAIEIAKRYPNVYATVGIHPHAAGGEPRPDGREAGKVNDADWKEFAGLITQDKVVAVGEIGLDYHSAKGGSASGGKNESSVDAQKDAFIRQLKLAKEHKKPIIVHDREAHSDCLKILKEVMGNQIKGAPPLSTGAGALLPLPQAGLPRVMVRGVAHCFSGSAEVAKEYLALGMYISVAGPVTYPNADELRKTVKAAIPVEKLMLETDCPFLAPQAMRGKRNEPAYLTHHIKELAKIYKLSEADIARITSLNAHHLFGIDISRPAGRTSPEAGGSPEAAHKCDEIKPRMKNAQHTITYAIRDSLYLNITNRCTCKCYFCVTHFTDYVKGHNLRLDSEPSSDEIIAAIPEDVHTRYKEVVFCGYGEPTLRLDVIKDVCRHLKKKDMAIRINTNGHGNIIANRPVSKELKGLVDSVSVSLNALDPKEYQKVCQSQFGEEAFGKVIEFIRDAKEHLPYVEVTTVMRPGVDVKPFQKLAGELGVDFRARIYNEVG